MNAFQIHSRPLPSNAGQEYSIWDMPRDCYLSNHDVFEELAANKAFRLFYNSILADCSFDAFYWEHPIISKDTINDPYRFALIKSSSLSTVTPDSKPFERKFDRQSSVVVFANLRSDALLVVPNASVLGALDLSSLARLVRTDKVDLIDAFWQQVAESVNNCYPKRPLYLNTAGNGVYWCHVRLDTRPKYYKCAAYR